ncbi:hypothetical protein [Phenylobacterium sp.]|uniref:hypothetical protein n=1 Tax=Phenylobacterium sp. TaxID=1871053 RepID=UPI0035B37102
MSATEPTEHRAEHSETAPVDARTDRRKVVIAPGDVSTILDACRRGVPETQIARALGVNYRTWMRLRVQDHRIASALAETKKVEEEELVSLLMDKARGGDTTALIFALKGRHGYRDSGVSVDVSVKNTGGALVVPPAPSASSWEAQAAVGQARHRENTEEL